MLEFDLAEINQLCLTPNAGNQAVVIRFRKESLNDLVFSLASLKNEDLTGELVGILSSAFKKKLGRNLDIQSSNALSYKSQKSNKTIMISNGASGPNSTFIKNKDGTVSYQ